MEKWDFSENRDKKRFYNARIKLWEYVEFPKKVYTELRYEILKMSQFLCKSLDKSIKIIYTEIFIPDLNLL